MSRLRFVGLIVLAVVWGAVLLTPTLRYVLQSQIQPQPMLNWDNGIDIARVAAEHPNDSRVLAAKIEIEAARKIRKLREGDDGTSYVYLPHAYDEISGQYKAISRAYDELIKKFPQDAWLLQNRLRNTQDVHISLEKRQSPKSPGAIYPIPPSRDELLQGLKIAEQGAQLEPQNSFFDWMRAVFLFALKRDNEALVALQEGSKKTGFDDGILRNLNNKIAVWQMQEPLFWEERFRVMYSEILPHLSLLNKTNRIALGYAKEAERKGNHARALELYEAQWKLGRTIVRQASLVITAMVGQRIVAGSWQGTGNLPTGKLQTMRMHKLAERFAAYARRHQRMDLAREAEQDAVKLELDHRFDDFGEQFFQLPSGQDARAIYRWKWFGKIFLCALLYCGLTWFALLCLHWLATRFRKVKVSSDKNGASASGDIAAVLFVLPAFVIALGAVWHFVNLQTFQDLALLGNIDPHTVALEHADLRHQLMRFERWLPSVPVFLALLYCTITAIWRGRKRSNEEFAPQAGSGIAAVIFVFTLFATLLFIFQQLRLMEQLSLSREAVMSWLPLYAPVLGVVAFLLYLLIRFGKSWWRGLSRSLTRLQFSPLLPNTLVLLSVILSVGYLMTSLASLPLRHEADQQLDILLRRGQVAMLRDRAAFQEP